MNQKGNEVYDYPGRAWSKKSLSTRTFDPSNPEKFISEADVERGGGDNGIIDISRGDTGAVLKMSADSEYATDTLAGILAEYHQSFDEPYQFVYEWIFAAATGSYPGSAVPEALVRTYRTEFDLARFFSLIGDDAKRFDELVQSKLENAPFTNATNLEEQVWQVAQEAVDEFGIRPNYRSAPVDVPDSGSLRSMVVSLYHDNSDGTVNEEFFDIIVGDDENIPFAVDIASDVIMSMVALAHSESMAHFVASTYATVEAEELLVAYNRYFEPFTTEANSMRVAKNFFS